MGLNDLQLSFNILAALYPSSLIQLDDPIAVTPRPTIQPALAETKDQIQPIQETKWKYLGNNQKNILIVVSYDNAVHLPDEEFGFLTNMLTACKLSLADVAIINHYHYKNNSYKDFLAEFGSKVVFLFGVDPLVFKLPVGFPPFQVQTVANCTFLYTPALEVQRQDTLLKSKLWVSLRTIFGI